MNDLTVMQEMMNSTGNALSIFTGELSKMMDYIKTSQLENSENFAKVNESIDNQDRRIGLLENNTKLDYYQTNNIRHAVQNRIDKLLGIKRSNGVVEKSCVEDDTRYRKAFSQAAYRECRYNTKLRRPIAETPAKEYDEIIEYINNWNPAFSYDGITGVNAIKRYADDRRKSR